MGLLTGRKVYTRNVVTSRTTTMDDERNLIGVSNNQKKNRSCCWKGRIELRSNDLSIFEDLLSSTGNISTFVSFLTNGLFKLFKPCSTKDRRNHLMDSDGKNEKEKIVADFFGGSSSDFSSFRDSNFYYRDPIFDLVPPAAQGEIVSQLTDNSTLKTDSDYALEKRITSPPAPRSPPQQTSTSSSTAEDIISRWKKTYSIRRQLKLALKE